MTSIDTH